MRFNGSAIFFSYDPKNNPRTGLIYTNNNSYARSYELCNCCIFKNINFILLLKKKIEILINETLIAFKISRAAYNNYNTTRNLARDTS